MNDINKIIKIYQEKIDKRLDELTSYKKTYSDIIIESCRYSLFSGGKRLRPFLFLSLLDGYSLKNEEYIDIACAIEMIHTYSLVHDDLPAMDNDELRRGKPTNHVKYGEDIAILAGDLLLNMSYEIMLDFILKYPTSESIFAVKSISYYAGYNGMISGQVLDVITEEKEISKEELKFIHKNKTSALIIASLLSAAILAKVTEKERNIVKDFGYNLGMAFQIRDDILDIMGDKKLLGKSIGKDEKEGKNTYPKYYGLDESEKLCKEYTTNAINNIEKLSIKNKKYFKEVSQLLLMRKK